MTRRTPRLVHLSAALLCAGAASVACAENFSPGDLFDLEIAADPRISPDGERVVFVRRSADIMKDRFRAGLWIVDHDGGEARPLGDSTARESAPRWSPDGRKLLFTSDRDGTPQLFVRWMDSGQTAQLTHLPKAPGGAAWSPDGRWIAFSMQVPDAVEPFVKMPAKPEGAEWAKQPNVIRRMIFRTDSAGYLEEAHAQIFVLPAEGGTPRQLTRGPRNHGGGLEWTPDGKHIVFAGNLQDDPDYDPLESEVHVLRVSDGAITPLTERNGPDFSPVVSPDGKRIAWLGFDDREQGYQVTQLHVMDRDGGNARVLTAGLDRDAGQPQWSADGRGLYFSYDDHGNTRIAFVSLDGKVSTVAKDLGGDDYGRPYAGGSFTVAKDGRFAFTLTRPDLPSSIAAGARGGTEVRRLTRLNEDLFASRRLGEVEELRWKSSFDGREIQGWVVRPPGFDAAKKYPMVLEIHGGPFTNYGDRFSAEMQSYAGAGYVTLYTNPRGSTSYGEEFGNLIHHAYPGNDYDDLMSGVDALLAKGYVDPQKLYITGGSGGGVLTAWSVSKTDRFRAAVVAKPVINWASFALTADNPVFFTRYWFGGVPWEDTEHFWARSPLSRVGHVNTPTMLLTGEADYRTPMSETEQYYAALKMRRIDTALVRIPESNHDMDGRPSFLVSKLVHILRWFETHP
jgi:acylaminoacyl-peptidase